MTGKAKFSLKTKLITLVRHTLTTSNKQQTNNLYIQEKESPLRTTVPIFGVDTRTTTGSLAQLETLLVVTATKRDISSLSVSARNLIQERYMQWKKKRRKIYTSSVRLAVTRTIGLHR